MDYLRWILLVAGIFFVLIIYFSGRKTKRQDDFFDYEKEDDIPEFGVSDQDDWENLEECIGDVRIVAREKDDYNIYDEYEDEESSLSDEIEDELESDASNAEADEQYSDNKSVIVLHILAKSSDRLAGDKINSAAQANGLKFGDMSIFHRIDDKQPIFSMANMVEPGAFDPSTIHELETPGLTLFMQKSISNNNTVIFDDMLECAYHMSEMLDAQLCNQKRQPLTQSDAEKYRELATSFDG